MALRRIAALALSKQGTSLAGRALGAVACHAPPTPGPGPTPRQLLRSISSTARISDAAQKAGDYQEETLDKERGGFDTSSTLKHDDGSMPAPHPSKLAAEKGSSYMLSHPVYDKAYLRSIVPRHRPPETVLDRVAFYNIQAIRRTYDFVTGYGPHMTKDKWLTRILFLETVAGVPGMVAGMIRHLHSLRLMRRDQGWIHTLLSEAENERLHLLTFLQLKQPGVVMRTAVLLTQGLFANGFFVAYLVSPAYCHRLVGYLEEEAVRTYTHLLSDMEDGKLPEWEGKRAPELAINYWRLHPEATMLDLVRSVRADEAHHSYVNHTFAGMKAEETNPFSPHSHKVP